MGDVRLLRDRMASEAGLEDRRNGSGLDRPRLVVRTPTAPLVAEDGGSGSATRISPPAQPPAHQTSRTKQGEHEHEVGGAVHRLRNARREERGLLRWITGPDGDEDSVEPNPESGDGRQEPREKQKEARAPIPATSCTTTHPARLGFEGSRDHDQDQTEHPAGQKHSVIYTRRTLYAEIEGHTYDSRRLEENRMCVPRFSSNDDLHRHLRAGRAPVQLRSGSPAPVRREALRDASMREMSLNGLPRSGPYW